MPTELLTLVLIATVLVALLDRVLLRLLDRARTSPYRGTLLAVVAGLSAVFVIGTLALGDLPATTLDALSMILIGMCIGAMLMTAYHYEYHSSPA